MIRVTAKGAVETGKRSLPAPAAREKSENAMTKRMPRFIHRATHKSSGQPAAVVAYMSTPLEAGGVRYEIRKKSCATTVVRV